MLNKWSSSGIWDEHHIDNTSVWALVESAKNKPSKRVQKSSNVSERSNIISTC